MPRLRLVLLRPVRTNYGSPDVLDSQIPESLQGLQIERIPAHPDPRQCPSQRLVVSDSGLEEVDDFLPAPGDEVFEGACRHEIKHAPRRGAMDEFQDDRAARVPGLHR